jgi:hypothetical protein
MRVSSRRVPEEPSPVVIAGMLDKLIPKPRAWFADLARILDSLIQATRPRRADPARGPQPGNRAVVVRGVITLAAWLTTLHGTGPSTMRLRRPMKSLRPFRRISSRSTGPTQSALPHGVRPPTRSSSCARLASALAKDSEPLRPTPSPHRTRSLCGTNGRDSRIDPNIPVSGSEYVRSGLCEHPVEQTPVNQWRRASTILVQNLPPPAHCSSWSASVCRSWWREADCK